MWIEDDYAQIGRLSRGYVQFVAGDPARSLLPVRDTLDLGYARRGSALQPPDVAVRFNAQCYALMHYVLLSGESETRQGQQRYYLTLLQRGVGENDALALASIDTAEWDDALRAYHGSGTLSSRESPAPDEFDPSTFEVGRLRNLDELLASGGYTYRTPYLRSQGPPSEERESLFRRAVGMDPDYVPALADLADLLIDGSANLDEALMLIGRARLIEPTVAASVHRLGRALLYSGHPEWARVASDMVRSWRPARGAAELADALDEEIAAYAESQRRRPALPIQAKAFPE